MALNQNIFLKFDHNIIINLLSTKFALQEKYRMLMLE